MTNRLKIAEANFTIAKLELLEAQKENFYTTHQLITIAQLNAISSENRGVTGWVCNYSVHNDKFEKNSRLFCTQKDGYRGHDVMFWEGSQTVYIEKEGVWFQIFKKLFLNTESRVICQ